MSFLDIVTRNVKFKPEDGIIQPLMSLFRDFLLCFDVERQTECEVTKQWNLLSPNCVKWYHGIFLKINVRNGNNFYGRNTSEINSGRNIFSKVSLLVKGQQSI